MRVVHVTNAGGFGRQQRGGAERAVEELSSAFAADPAWRVTVVAPPEFLDLGRFDPRVTRRPVALRELSPARALHPRGELQRVLRGLDPDVVLAHLLRGTLVGVPAARLATSAATVSILHNSLHDSLPARGERRARDLANLAAFRLVGRLASAHVAISESNARDLVRRDRQPPARVHLIHNWVAPEFTEAGPVDRAAVRASLGVGPAGRLVLCAGRLERQKRQDFLIELLPRLGGVTLALLGDGSLRPVYEALAEARGVRDRVRFLGFRRDVPGLMAAADVVAVPSAFEGFGRVAVEALAVGTPVVASRVAGLRDALRGAPEGAALLVDPADGPAWAAAIDRACALVAGAPERAAMRGWAASRYSLDSRVAAYRALVQKVAAREEPPGRAGRAALR